MVFYNLTIGKWKCKYKFPKEEVETADLPYCDSQLNILKRINETEQIKTKVRDLTKRKAQLEYRKDNQIITDEEKEELKKVEVSAYAYQDVMNMKAYFVNEETGDIHLKALRKLGDEALEKSKKTEEIPDGEYAVCDIIEKDRYLSEQRGELLCPELYNFLKEQSKAVKFAMNFGFGLNEQRVYVYPSNDIPDLLIIGKVGRTKFKDVVIADLEELKEYNKMKEMLEAIQLQATKQNKNKIAGKLDDW